MSMGLVLATSVHEGDTPRARLELIVRRDGAWHVEHVEGGPSNVFHRAACFDPPGETPPGIVTAGGMEAAMSIWRRAGDGFVAEELWRERFGASSSRMRDFAIGPFLGPSESLVVGTHDEGVVATISFEPEATVRELDRRAHTYVHEVELGDLDGDGALETIVTTSPPNAFIVGLEQPGDIVRFLPDGRREVLVALPRRHAKEIFVADLDRDGRDELYAAIEARTEERPSRIVEPIEVRRWTSPTESRTIATIEGDRHARFLTAGDLDGDGQDELVLSTAGGSVWELDPAGHAPPHLLLRDGGGAEHAALAADLDGDGRAELYVADDTAGILSRWEWVNGERSVETVREVAPGSVVTWNIETCPAARMGP